MGKDYKPPTEIIKNMGFDEWLELAKSADSSKLSNKTEHYYFMANAPPKDTKTFISKDLPVFSTKVENFFISNVHANKGIVEYV